MNDVLLMVLLICGFFTVLLSLGLRQEKREFEQRKADERARRLKWANAHASQVNQRAKWAAAAAAHGVS